MISKYNIKYWLNKLHQLESNPRYTFALDTLMRIEDNIIDRGYITGREIRILEHIKYSKYTDYGRGLH